MKRILIAFVVFCILFSFGSFVRADDSNIEVKVATDKTYYLPGEPVKITYTITNNGDSAVRFTFNTSQIYDFSIVNLSYSKLVYRWSLGKKFAQVITYLEVPARSSKKFTAVWDQKSNKGTPAGPGGYNVNFWLVTGKSIPGKGLQSSYLAINMFQISGAVNIPFQDIADPYIQGSVRLLYLKGLIKGYPDSTFRPNKHLTRTEGTVLTLRVMGVTPSGNYHQDFSDVPTDFWGFKWIEEAYKRGIVKGVGGGKFLPNGGITRGEFVTMLVRALKISPVEKENPFADLESSYFGYKEIIVAYYNGITLGVRSGDKIYFKPFSTLTRGEAANFMARAVSTKSEELQYSIKESIEEKPFTAEETPVTYTPDVPDYTIQTEKIKNLFQYPLTDHQLNILKNYGFFIKKSDYDTFTDFYDKNSEKPLFISFDTFLQAYHVIFDMSLRYDEIQYFTKDLDELGSSMITNSIAQYHAAPPDLKEAAKRNIAFFYIGEKLLDPDYLLVLNPALRKEVEDIANKEFALVNAHNGIAVSPLFGYKEDYSQYVPRGHYTRNEAFKHYFKSMMWYGRMRFLLKPGISKEAIEIGRSQTQSAILITLVLASSSHLAALYDRIYEPTVFFVGRADDINFYSYIPIVKAVYGETVSLSGLTDTSKLDSFIDKALALPNPKISTTGETEVNKEKGFRFMGQRFTLDAYILQNLVYPKAGYRMLPKAMDVFNVFGNKEAGDVMLNFYEEKKNDAYIKQVKTLREEVNDFTTKDWLQNLYWGWLSLLKIYTKGERGNGYPFFMQNTNWAKKELFTGLASYTELKHDTILYAKQSYTLKGAPPAAQAGYVEPNIEGYGRLLILLDMTEDGLSARGLLPDILKEKIESLKTLTQRALEISKKELENTPLSDNDKVYFLTFASNVKSLFIFPDDFSSKVMGAGDGKTALVADIHTDPNAGVVLEEGVGNVFEIYVVAQYNNILYLFKGPIFSYYEFTKKMSNRLTDEEWQSMLEEGNAPDLPGWIEPLIP